MTPNVTVVTGKTSPPAITYSAGAYRMSCSPLNYGGNDWDQEMVAGVHGNMSAILAPGPPVSWDTGTYELPGTDAEPWSVVLGAIDPGGGLVRMSMLVPSSSLSQVIPVWNTDPTGPSEWHVLRDAIRPVGSEGAGDPVFFFPESMVAYDEVTYAIPPVGANGDYPRFTYTGGGSPSYAFTGMLSVTHGGKTYDASGGGGSGWVNFCSSMTGGSPNLFSVNSGTVPEDMEYNTKFFPDNNLRVNGILFSSGGPNMLIMCSPTIQTEFVASLAGMGLTPDYIIEDAMIRSPGAGMNPDYAWNRFPRISAYEAIHVYVSDHLFTPATSAPEGTVTVSCNVVPSVGNFITEVVADFKSFGGSEVHLYPVNADGDWAATDIVLPAGLAEGLNEVPITARSTADYTDTNHADITIEAAEAPVISSSVWVPDTVPNDSATETIIRVTLTGGAATGVEVDTSAFGGSPTYPLSETSPGVWECSPWTFGGGVTADTYDCPVSVAWSGGTVTGSASLTITAEPSVTISSAELDPSTAPNDEVTTVKAKCDIALVDAVLDSATATLPWSLVPLTLTNVGGNSYESEDFTIPNTVVPGIQTVEFEAVAGGLSDTDSANILVTAAPEAEGWAAARVSEEYSCTVDLAPSGVISAVRTAYPTPNWVSDLVWNEALGHLTIGGVPNLAGRFLIVVEGLNISDEWVEMPAPADNPYIIVNEANFNPATETTLIAGSKTYVVEPGQAIQIAEIPVGEDPIMDPDMKFENTDPTNSMLVTVNVGGRLIGVKPDITTEGSESASINELYKYDGSDEESGPEVTGTLPIRFAVVSSPADFIIHPVSGKVTWMPDTLGTYSVRIRALNTAGFVDESIVITVTAIPTEITSTIPASVPNATPYSKQLEADGSPVVRYSGSISPADPTFHVSLTGLLTWEPLVSVSTDFTITITATGPGGTDTVEFPVHIEV